MPCRHADEAEKQLNAFLSQTSVIRVDREFVVAGDQSFWSYAVEFVAGGVNPAKSKSNGGRERIDYREVLEPEQLEVFARLRELRKKIAEADGVPPYAIFTNEQLAEMVRQKVKNAAGIGKIDGVGPSRVEKYAERFVVELAS